VNQTSKIWCYRPWAAIPAGSHSLSGPILFHPHTIAWPHCAHFWATSQPEAIERRLSGICDDCCSSHGADDWHSCHYHNFTKYLYYYISLKVVEWQETVERICSYPENISTPSNPGMKIQTKCRFVVHGMS
jgi:hypothetical protein